MHAAASPLVASAAPPLVTSFPPPPPSCDHAPPTYVHAFEAALGEEGCKSADEPLGEAGCPGRVLPSSSDSPYHQQPSLSPPCWSSADLHPSSWPPASDVPPRAAARCMAARAAASNLSLTLT